MSKTSIEALESLEGARILSAESKGATARYPPYAVVLTTTDGDVITIRVCEDGLDVELRTP